MSRKRIWRDVCRYSFCKKYRTKNKKGVPTAIKACVRKSSANWAISLKNSVMEVSYIVIKVDCLVVPLRKEDFIKWNGRD
jgi:hypothetical protein